MTVDKVAFGVIGTISDVVGVCSVGTVFVKTCADPVIFNEIGFSYTHAPTIAMEMVCASILAVWCWFEGW